MSESSQAFEHANIHRRLGHEREAEGWYGHAINFLRKDHPWPGHLDLHAVTDGVTIGCDRCGTTRLVTSVASAMDFRDWHRHCGEDSVPAARCSCNMLNFRDEERCQFCRSTDNIEDLNVAPAAIYNQVLTYDIYLQDRWVGSITTGSLRRARRAARAMFPGDGAWLRAPAIEGDGWPAEVT